MAREKMGIKGRSVKSDPERRRLRAAARGAAQERSSKERYAEGLEEEGFSFLGKLVRDEDGAQAASSLKTS